MKAGLKEIRELVPESTLRYFLSEEAGEVVKADSGKQPGDSLRKITALQLNIEGMPEHCLSSPACLLCIASLYICFLFLYLSVTVIVNQASRLHDLPLFRRHISDVEPDFLNFIFNHICSDIRSNHRSESFLIPGM